MKIKSSLLTLTLLLSGALASNGAVFAIGNVVDFATDTLYADKDNNLMNGGIVTIGYFASTIADADIDTIPELFAQLGGFTVASSFVPGSLMGTYSISAAGYADNSDTAASAGLVTSTLNTALFGRTVYSIVSSAASLNAALATSQFALVKIGTIGNDEGGELTYVSNPAGKTPIGTVGSIGSFNGSLGIDFDGPGGDPALPAGTYGTLKMAAVPEPSAALLGAIGALGLLRRRRN
jgi:hypothetical protein